jgi:hypothetical protein
MGQNGTKLQSENDCTIARKSFLMAPAAIVLLSKILEFHTSCSLGGW